MSAAGVIDHEAQYGDDDYLCYADHRSDYLNAVTILKGCASRFGPNAELVYGHYIFNNPLQGGPAEIYTGN